MRKTLLAAAAAFVIGGTTVGSFMSYAQPAPPPPHGPGMMGPGAWPHHGPMPWLHHWHGPRLIEPGALALIYRHPDRNLTPADVQTIAQAFLLWNGNHDWKVVDVKQAAGGAIEFALATAQNSVIARFAMNPHTGHLSRIE